MTALGPAGVVVNDIHSQLNETSVREVVPVGSLDAVRAAVLRARELGVPVCIAGGRHAMGGQQFGTDGLLIDTRPLARVLAFDDQDGAIEVEAGIQWPALLDYLRGTSWAFRQKQTGADRLSLGGALSANGHGRGLTLKPIVADVESFELVGPDAELRTCSREENSDLFALAAGGYGLLGAIYSLRLRLTPRRKLERVVDVRELDGLMGAFDERIADGFLYGDFQFAIDPAGDAFLRRGVFSCYRPVEDDTPIPTGQRALTTDDWRRLLHLTHTDKAQAFERYAAHYLATSGQLYWSDAHQSAEYIDDYHRALDQATGGGRATEMISELYVPRGRLIDFMTDVADDFRRTGVDVIYGTVRLIERDVDSFLAWAREPWACVIFNLHTVHTREKIEHSKTAFRRLIDLAIARGGSYFLTYHRWARRDQVEACYPQFREFLHRKRERDPDVVFRSDWYDHHVELLSGE
jgi:FAD/FMN-containing dehydrogenase